MYLAPLVCSLVLGKFKKRTYSDRIDSEESHETDWPEENQERVVLGKLGSDLLGEDGVPDGHDEDEPGNPFHQLGHDEVVFLGPVEAKIPAEVGL